MFFKIIASLFIVVFAVQVIGVDYVLTPNLIHQNAWFRTIVTELLLEQEEDGWSNLRFEDILSNFSVTAIDQVVIGNITYSEGYLHSLNFVELTNASQVISESSKTAMVEGEFRINDLTFAFDVDISLENGTTASSSATMDIAYATFWVMARKTLDQEDEELIVNVRSYAHAFSPFFQVPFRPSNDLTIMAGTNFYANASRPLSTTLDNWAEKFEGKVRQKIENEHPFPSICYNCPDGFDDQTTI